MQFPALQRDMQPKQRNWEELGGNLCLTEHVTMS